MTWLDVEDIAAIVTLFIVAVLILAASAQTWLN